MTGDRGRRLYGPGELRLAGGGVRRGSALRGRMFWNRCNALLKCSAPGRIGGKIQRVARTGSPAGVTESEKGLMLGEVLNEG